MKPSERIAQIKKGHNYDDLWTNDIEAIIQYLDEIYEEKHREVIVGVDFAKQMNKEL